MSRLPRDACIHTTIEERLQEGWTVTDDLLAMLIEVTSVPAAGRKLKKPIEVPRPKKPKAKAKDTAAPGRGPQDAAYKKAINVLASTARRR